MLRLVKTVFIIVSVGLVYQGTIKLSHAGDAVFSNDGRRIYLIASNDKRPAIREINLTDQTSRIIPLTQLSQNDYLVGITRSEWDKLPLITRKSIWAFDPRSGKLSKIRDAAKNGDFFRITYDPKSRQIFVTTNEGLFLLKNGRELVSVFVRRHNAIGCPVFASSGEMFFAESGDLWHGKIELEENNYSVTAYRYAPLAALETANTTPNETGVTDIGPAHDIIYVHLNRLNGSGWGWLAQLARPKNDKPEDFGVSVDPAQFLPMFKTVLDSVKVLGENTHATNLCVSPDETRVYYSDGDKDWLITNGQAQELKLRAQ